MAWSRTVPVLMLPMAALMLLAACASDHPEPQAPEPPRAAAPAKGRPAKRAAAKETYDQQTILDTSKRFFGGATEGLAKVVQKVFEEHGEPNGYIAGEEGSGALVVGLRYGGGFLYQKNRAPRRVYWQGPSIGFDGGGNASKVFVLVYHLDDPQTIFGRYPGVDGSYYFVAGVGVNYQQLGRVILAPIRTGVGLRAGVNVGYLRYSRKRDWVPF